MGEESASPESDSYALASAIALAATGGSREIDFRRGPFVYRASFSIMRQKALHLAVLGGALLVAGVIDVSAKLRRWVTSARRWTRTSRPPRRSCSGNRATTRRRSPRSCAGVFARRWRRCPRRPRSICWTRSRARCPPPIASSWTSASSTFAQEDFIKGTVDTAAAVDEMMAKLKEIDCFDEVTKGSITEVSGGAKQFTLNIGSKCP